MGSSFCKSTTRIQLGMVKLSFYLCVMFACDQVLVKVGRMLLSLVAISWFLSLRIGETMMKKTEILDELHVSCRLWLHRAAHLLA